MSGPLHGVRVLDVLMRGPGSGRESALRGLQAQGFEITTISNIRGGLAVNESADRILETIVLARRFPQASIIFTGGEGAIVPTTGSRIPRTSTSAQSLS